MGDPISGAYFSTAEVIPVRLAAHEWLASIGSIRWTSGKWNRREERRLSLHLRHGVIAACWDNSASPQSTLLAWRVASSDTIRSIEMGARLDDVCGEIESREIPPASKK